MRLPPNVRRRSAPGVAGLVLLVTLGAMAGGCGSRSGTPVAPVVPPVAPELSPAGDVADCVLIADPGEPIATVALGERVDPANAPHPSNDSEQLLFRQLYETLVRVDCEAQVRPGLAASWQPGEDESTWVVRLRENARFSDGTPVTSADVLSGWTRSGAGEDLRDHVTSYVRSVVVVDDRTLAITLHGERARAPRILADTGLAIAKRSPGSSWPLGTHALRVVPDQVAPDLDSPTVITVTGIARDAVAADSDTDSRSVRFLVDPDRDPRDFLDQGVDLLLTRDPATLDYAATLPQFQVMPLSWQRTHVFLSAWRSRSLEPLPPDTREALARDAVRGDARGARGPFWWEAQQECGIDPRPQGRAVSATTGRIVYERDDHASRDLAERFVGLTTVSGAGTVRPGPASTPPILDALPLGPTLQRAVGLSGEALWAAYERGTDVGYIMTFTRTPLDPCRELRVLGRRLAWFDPGAIVPLVDTRVHAIARRGRAGATAEWDGGVFLTRAGSGR